MRALTLLRPDIAIPLMREFLGWYLREILRIPQCGFAYAKACNVILPIPFLLRTLFAPWKNIIERPAKLTIVNMGPVLALNLISRAVGAVVRIGAIIVAIAVQVAVLACTISYLLLWIAYPPVLLFVVAHITLVSLA